ncbi:MAG: YceI family protein [Candidatus Sericytochromatia bacterium]
MSEWKFDASNAELLVKTGVAGRAARMGHRLTIAMRAWHATVTWAGDEPSSVELAVDVDSLEVLRGEGGVTPLSGPEKALARSNALKTLGAQRFPSIKFRADDVAKTADGYHLTGTVEIHGTSRPQTVELRVEDAGDTWRMSAEVPVRQSDFGVKPYSMFLGSMKVADEVTVAFSATRSKSA